MIDWVVNNITDMIDFGAVVIKRNGYTNPKRGASQKCAYIDLNPEGPFQTRR